MLFKRKVVNALLVSSLLVVPLSHVSAKDSGKVAEVIAAQEVTQEDAKKAIGNFISSESYLVALKDGNISFKENLYDTEDNLIGYYFEVESSETKGYFITSAVDTIDPFIQYGIDGNLAELLSQKDDHQKVYYFGAMKFYFAESGKELKHSFEKAKKSTLGKLKAEGKLEEDELNRLEKLELKNIKKGDKKSPGWKKVLEGEQNNIVSAAATTYKTLAVDRIYQRASGINNPGSACGATTAAMIMDYYYDVMGYRVWDNAYYGSWAKLVNHLYNEMGSTWIGTSLSMWKSGALTHVRHASSPWGASQYSDAVGYSSKFIASIDSNDPVAIRFDRFDAGGSTIEYHFVAGIGYNKNASYTGDLHVAYKDPDNGSTNTATHWLDWTDDDNDFGFAYLY